MSRHPLDIPRPDWMARAACLGMGPDFFFPSRGQDTRGPKAVCASCSVSQECLAYAIENAEKHGLWAGVAERNRRRLRAASKNDGQELADVVNIRRSAR